MGDGYSPAFMKNNINGQYFGDVALGDLCDFFFQWDEAYLWLSVRLFKYYGDGISRWRFFTLGSLGKNSNGYPIGILMIILLEF